MQALLARFSVRAMLMAVAVCAALAWLVARMHAEVLFHAVEPEQLREAFNGARLKIYYAFTPIFIVIACLGTFSVVRALQRIGRSERAVSELLITLPALALLFMVNTDGTTGIALALAALAAPWLALLLKADEPRRLVYPVAINTAWALCMACYVYLTLQHASEL